MLIKYECAEDASKIQRIVERFELGKVDKVSIVSKSEKAVKTEKIWKINSEIGIFIDE